jgi:hypothetical protein
MKIRITLGELEIRTEGLELTKRDVRQLLKDLASIGVALSECQPAAAEETRQPIGFSVITERAEPAEPDYSEFFDDE